MKGLRVEGHFGSGLRGLALERRRVEILRATVARGNPGMDARGTRRIGAHARGEHWGGREESDLRSEETRVG